jgi:hypothetical protein
LLLSIASPGSLRSLSLTSKAAYKFFNPTLYESINEPAKVGKLLVTLGCERRVALGAHPASLVRDLHIYYCLDLYQCGDGLEGQKKKGEVMQFAKRTVLRALDNTARVSSGRSRLQSFWLTSNAAVEDIGPLLLKRSRFPHLEDLRITIPVSYDLKSERKSFQVRH